MRIAWSVVWGVVAVLFVVLWVRSYSFLDYCQMHVAGGNTLHIQFVNGQVKLFRLQMKHELRLGCLPVGQEASSPMYERPVTGKVLFGGGIARGLQIESWSSSSYGELNIHHWLLSVTAVALGAVPWLGWRFTLRTLLIVTTAAATVLGLIVWSIHR